MPKGVYQRVLDRFEVENPSDSTARSIPLTQGKVAIVDVDDYKELSKWNWHAHRDRKTGKYYAMRAGPTPERRLISMHREILKPATGFFVDHIHESMTLDNRRCNLRIATRAQNALNTRNPVRGSSGLRGVKKVFHKGQWNGSWRAAISIEGKRLHLGVFQTAELAAQRYDEVAKQNHGEFACLNK